MKSLHHLLHSLNEPFSELLPEISLLNMAITHTNRLIHFLPRHSKCDYSVLLLSKFSFGLFDFGLVLFAQFIDDVVFRENQLYFFLRFRTGAGNWLMGF
jgi:hypothetical protein